MPSDYRGMGSVASHLRGSSVHSIVYWKIYMGMVGKKLPSHTTPLRLLHQRLGFLRRRNFFHLAPFVLHRFSCFQHHSPIRSLPLRWESAACSNSTLLFPNG